MERPELNASAKVSRTSSRNSSEGVTILGVSESLFFSGEGKLIREGSGGDPEMGCEEEYGVCLATFSCTGATGVAVGLTSGDGAGRGMEERTMELTSLSLNLVFR